jgi:hypothetical protein
MAPQIDINALLETIRNPPEKSGREKLQDALSDVLGAIGAGLANRGRRGQSTGAGAALAAGGQLRRQRTQDEGAERQQALQNALSVAGLQQQRDQARAEGKRDKLEYEQAAFGAAEERRESREGTFTDVFNIIQPGEQPGFPEGGLPMERRMLGELMPSVAGQPEYIAPVNTGQELLRRAGVEQRQQQRIEQEGAQFSREFALFEKDPAAFAAFMGRDDPGDLSKFQQLQDFVGGPKVWAGLSQQEKGEAMSAFTDFGKGTPAERRTTQFEQELEMFRKNPDEFAAFKNRDPKAAALFISETDLGEIDPEDTLWARTNWWTTGAPSWIPRYIGAFLGWGEVSRGNMQAFANAKNTMIRALAENPKYAVSEAERLSREINIEPSFWRAPDDLKVSMREIDKSLATVIERRKMMGDEAAVLTINQFRKIMGVPPGVGSGVYPTERSRWRVVHPPGA